MDLRLNNASVFTICGPSLSGKTVFVEELIRSANKMFKEQFSNIFWFCVYIPPVNARLPHVNYYEGVPENIEDILIPYCCCIIDDLMSECKNLS